MKTPGPQNPGVLTFDIESEVRSSYFFFEAFFLAAGFFAAFFLAAMFTSFSWFLDPIHAGDQTGPMSQLQALLARVGSTSLCWQPRAALLSECCDKRTRPHLSMV